MTADKFFLDTSFLQALLNPKDQYHQIAKIFFPVVKNASEVWLTEAILMEFGNALSNFNRPQVVNFIQQCYQTKNIQVVNISASLFQEALVLYGSRLDKQWGLVDCISFVVMKQQGLIMAITSDRHFIQAGFQALLIE